VRRLRSFLFLVVAAAGLGAYIYFVEAKRAPSSEPAAKPKVFGEVAPDKIEEITVALKDGDRTTLQKSGNDWQIVQPATFAADQTEASSIATNLSTLEVQHVVDENPGDLKEYGLTEPRADIAFRLAGTKEPKRLLIGNKTATNSDIYAKIPSEKRVILVPGYLESTFVRSTFDLRDKGALKFDRDKVDTIQLVSGGKTVGIKKEGNEWMLTEPLKARADFGTVEGLLGPLSSAQMKKIVSAEPPPPGDVKKYGLAAPAITARIGAGSTQATLAVGGDAEDGTVYARDLSRPSVFTLESTVATELKKGAADFRRKDVFEFRPFNAKRIEVSRNGQTVVFERTENKDAKGVATEKWIQTAPSFVDSVAGTGLDAPAMTVVVRYDDGKHEERVTFAAKGDEVHAARAGEPGAAKIAKTDYDSAIKAIDELK
jgi:hypothetical protein